MKSKKREENMVIIEKSHNGVSYTLIAVFGSLESLIKDCWKYYIIKKREKKHWLTGKLKTVEDKEFVGWNKKEFSTRKEVEEYLDEIFREDILKKEIYQETQKSI